MDQHAEVAVGRAEAVEGAEAGGRAHAEAALERAETGVHAGCRLVHVSIVSRRTITLRVTWGWHLAAFYSAACAMRPSSKTRLG